METLFSQWVKCGNVHISLESFSTTPKSQNRMKVSDVGRNLVPDAWTANGEGALPEQSPFPYYANVLTSLSIIV